MLGGQRISQALLGTDLMLRKQVSRQTTLHPTNPRLLLPRSGLQIGQALVPKAIAGTKLLHLNRIVGPNLNRLGQRLRRTMNAISPSRDVPNRTVQSRKISPNLEVLNRILPNLAIHQERRSGTIGCQCHRPKTGRSRIALPL
jgi:hypothetical protein